MPTHVGLDCVRIMHVYVIICIGFSSHIEHFHWYWFHWEHLQCTSYVELLDVQSHAYTRSVLRSLSTVTLSVPDEVYIQQVTRTGACTQTAVLYYYGRTCRQYFQPNLFMEFIVDCEDSLISSSGSPSCELSGTFGFSGNSFWKTKLWGKVCWLPWP